MTVIVLCALGSLGWLACAAGAIWLMEDAWRRDFDLSKADRRFFVRLSLLGPLALIAASIYWADIDWSSADGGNDAIIKPKKANETSTPLRERRRPYTHGTWR